MTAPALDSLSTFESSSLYRMLRQRTRHLEEALSDHPLVAAIRHARLGRHGYARLAASMLTVRESIDAALADANLFSTHGLDRVAERARRCTTVLRDEVEVLLDDDPDLRPVPAARQLADVVAVDGDHLPFLLGRHFALERVHKMFRRSSTALGLHLDLGTGDHLAIGGDDFERRPIDDFADCVDSMAELQRHRSDVAIAAQETFEDLETVLDQMPAH